MNNKKIILFALIGLLTVSCALPTIVAAKPSWALESDDVEGWWVYAEGEISNWNYSYSELINVSFNAWYQIWIDYNTSPPTPWLNANACMCIIVMEFSDDLVDYTLQVGDITLEVNLWVPIAYLLVGGGSVLESVEGLTQAYSWSSGGVWASLGYKGNKLVIAFGYDSQAAPMNPFEAGILAKTPTETGAEKSDILSLMGAQASSFTSGIPGFSFLLPMISVIVIVSIIFLQRKDQLKL